jgi:hypothetical protein
MFDFCIHYTTFPQKARLKVKNQTGFFKCLYFYQVNHENLTEIKNTKISQNFITWLELFGWKALVRIVQLFHVL